MSILRGILNDAFSIEGQLILNKLRQIKMKMDELGSNIPEDLLAKIDEILLNTSELQIGGVDLTPVIALLEEIKLAVDNKVTTVVIYSSVDGQMEFDSFYNQNVRLEVSLLSDNTAWNTFEYKLRRKEGTNPIIPSIVINGVTQNPIISWSGDRTPTYQNVIPSVERLSVTFGNQIVELYVKFN